MANRGILSSMSDLRCELAVSIFQTSLGWFGLLGTGQAVRRVQIGHPSAAAVRRALQGKFVTETDWSPELRHRLEDFTEGARDDFSDVPLLLPTLTPFQTRVLEHVRRIGYGLTESYGEVARRVGSPRAARAVGSVMAGNPVPLLIPCHRVVSSSGRLGGFSAPQGPRLKQRLLALEA